MSNPFEDSPSKPARNPFDAPEKSPRDDSTRFVFQVQWLFSYHGNYGNHGYHGYHGTWHLTMAADFSAKSNFAATYLIKLLIF